MNELIPSGIKKSRYYGNNTNKLHELQYQMILVWSIYCSFFGWALGHDNNVNCPTTPITTTLQTAMFSKQRGILQKMGNCPDFW